MVRVVVDQGTKRENKIPFDLPIYFRDIKRRERKVG
jgi:hypothetical protein